MQRYQGKHGQYLCDDAGPFAFGRNSVILAGRDDHGTVVALKVFRSAPQNTNEDDLTSEFFTELRAHSDLSHANVLPILDFGVSDTPVKAPFVVMPMCEAGNLRQFMKTMDYVPLDRCRDILTQIGSAVDAAHRQGILHGDIKPENILFSSDRKSAYLADFGVAKYFPVHERFSTHRAEERSSAGTSAYMSPEQIENGVQTPRSDVYSFAIVTYELLVGALPFNTAVTPYKQMQAKIAGELINARTTNPLVTVQVEDALMWGLRVKPSDRPQSASDFIHALEGTASVPKAAAEGFWERLEPSGKVAIITASIAALGGLITAVVKVIPELMGKAH